METLHVKVEGDQQHLEIRTGEAQVIRDPNKVVVRGDISTVATFLEKRNVDNAGLQGLIKDKSVIYTDKSNRKITIDIDPENHFGAKVIGELELSDELKQFNINDKTTFNREKLVKLIRFTKRHFDSAEVYLNILTSYTAFKASTSTDLEVETDNRGNKKGLIDKKVSSNLPEYFALNIPIFKGQPKEKFMVEICLELTDAGAHFWFESPELEELIALRIDEIFDKQLEGAKELVVVNI